MFVGLGAARVRDLFKQAKEKAPCIIFIDELDALGKARGVGMAEVEEAVERVVAGLEKKNRLINSEEKKIVAYHELGHALVAMALPGTDPVQKISIIPRGIAALGYTMQVPTEDRFLMRKTELENRIATLLGGRAAEAFIFNDISTGAQNDLSRATDIARSMVKEYGMSERMGQVYFSNKQQPAFLGAMGDAGGQYSDETAKTIDEEVRRIIEIQYDVALQILKANRDLLVKTVGQLLKDEVIEGDALIDLAESVNHTEITDDSPAPVPTRQDMAA